MAGKDGSNRGDNARDNPVKTTGTIREGTNFGGPTKGEKVAKPRGTRKGGGARKGGRKG